MPTPDYPDYTLPIVVIGSVTVVGTVSIEGPVEVSGTVSISGTVTVTGNVIVTGAVTVGTIGADNIVIDRLTVTAYKARTDTLRNDNGVTSPTAPPDSYTGVTYHGKFFPRGCRGNIGSLSIYCKRTGSGTITLSYSPQMGMAAIGSVEIEPDTDWDWYSGDVDKFWNYDSMFIWISACDGDVSYGWENAEPYDDFSSVDGNPPWSLTAARQFIAIELEGATAGDLPVSGTLNTVEIPHSSSESDSGFVSVPNNTYTSLVKINGSGNMLSLLLRVLHENSQCLIYADGTFVVNYMPSDLNGRGFTSSTPGVTLLKYQAGAAENDIFITLPFNFKSSIEVKGFQLTGGAVNMLAKIITNLIK